MKAFIIIILSVFLALPIITMAGEITIQSQFPDPQPGDGIMDAGSPLNPYILRDDSGQEIGRMRSRYSDTDSSDGIFDPGSILNPWVIETQD